MLTSSQRDEYGRICASTTSSVLGLPDELLIFILQLLKPPEVLRMRQCCSRLYLLTQDKSLWIALATYLSQSHPLPSPARIRNLNLPELEQITIQAGKIKTQWIAPRQSPPRQIDALYRMSHHKFTLDYLKVFEGRFAIALYAEPGVVLLWDLDGLQFHGNTRKHGWGRVVAQWSTQRRLVRGTWKSRFCESTQEIITVGLFLGSPGQFTILSVCISGNPARERTFQQADITMSDLFTTYSALSPISLSPEASIIAYIKPSQPEEIFLTSWKTGLSKSLAMCHRTPNDEDSASNVVSLEIFQPYLITVKQSHLEIYLLPPDLENQGNSARMSTQTEVLDFQGEMFSSASLALRETDSETLQIVVALSNIFGTVSYYILHLPRNPYDLGTSFSFQQTLLYVDESLATRGVFVGSSISLGSSGMRAVWIEKSRRLMERTIFVLAIDEGVGHKTGVLETSVGGVYTMSSANFEDDPIHVECDEVAGRIVVATRGGQLLIFDCWHRVAVERKPLMRFHDMKDIHRGLEARQ